MTSPSSFLLAFAGCVFFALPSVSKGEVLHGRIVGVADGDTVTLLDANNVQHKIRLQGIDAPEKNQPYGSASKRRLSDLVFGRTVGAACSKTDRYRRLICRIDVNGVDVNLAMITAGMAWHYKAYEMEQTSTERTAYVLAEEQARLARTGLWLDHSPTPPWGFRKAKREADMLKRMSKGAGKPQ
ncbi:thermonuclease family protein [Denitromonas halophila]|uniref:Thermonuclease family protein n=1 Tax=Denitromonas halophila TaxID=1629404 RepID=A0A557QJI3_9RHOO|nr:thermonuclease family protein [Denitromonas halophila]TVO53066.1 thermonuclease family protein [Denitromonas halophila]